jgi:hypothetical protein
MKTEVTPSEKGTAVVKGEFRNSIGDLVTPTSAVWTLKDVDRVTVNGKLNIAITPLATSFSVTLTKNDLVIVCNKRVRYFITDIIYDSDEGTGLTNSEELEFDIKNLKGKE